MTIVQYPVEAEAALFALIAPVDPAYLPSLTKGDLRQLGQLRQLTWDGDLISKPGRDRLNKLGFVARIRGWNLITKVGLEFLIDQKMLKA